MTKDQKTVAVGAISGVVTMAALVWILSRMILPPAIADMPGERLAYALKWAVVVVLPLLMAILSIGNARFNSEAIDPTLGRETPAMTVDGRVAQNTLEQTVLFLVGMLGLAVTLPIYRLNLVAAVTITFVVMRLAFWAGYRVKPVHRAFGFAGTGYLNISILAAALWLWAR